MLQDMPPSFLVKIFKGKEKNEKKCETKRRKGKVEVNR
jgi:hypothetical protein